MRIWATQISNAYLEAKTLEKIYIISGTGFGIREGHIMIISLFYLLNLYDMECLMIVSEIWDYLHESWNLLFGYDIMEAYIHKIMCIWMTS